MPVALSLYPARNDHIGYLWAENDYDIKIVVTGLNFDAVRYHGRIRYRFDRENGNITFEGIETLKRE